MQARILAASVIAFLGLTTPSIAQGKMQPGLWKMTVTREVNGKSMPSPEMTQCIKEDMSKMQGMSPQQENASGCKMQDLKSEGKKTSFRTICSGARESETFTTINYLTPTHYTMETRTSSNSGGRKIESVMKMSAVRVGNCPN